MAESVQYASGGLCGNEIGFSSRTGCVHVLSCFDLPALKHGNKKEQGAVESNHRSKKDDYISVAAVVDRDHPVDQRQHRQLRQVCREVKHELGG